MITWAELFEGDGSPLQVSYRTLRPAISTRTAGVLDEAAGETWFRRDTPWSSPAGVGMARELLRLRNCGAAVIAELSAIRMGLDWERQRDAVMRSVSANLTGATLARVAEHQKATQSPLGRADLLGHLVLVGLEHLEGAGRSRPKDTMPERTVALEQAYLDGATMAQIAARFGLTKQRVEQLLRPARNAGRIPAELRAARKDQARKTRAASPDRRADFAKAQAARWEQKGYSAPFKQLVAQAARRDGVPSASREWGVPENSVRRWREQYAPG